MNKNDLYILVQAAETGLIHIADEHARESAQLAIDAAYLKLGKRKKPYVRLSRTATRAHIRRDLRAWFHKVRLNQLGEWHVQALPGACWLIFALNDIDAQEQLIDAKAKRDAALAVPAQG